MRCLLVVASAAFCLFALAAAQTDTTPKRTACINKVYTLGLKYPKKPTATSCLVKFTPTIVSNCSAGLPLMTIGTNMMNQAMANMNWLMTTFGADFGTLMSKYGVFNTCLSKCSGSPTAISLVMQIATALMSGNSAASGSVSKVQSYCNAIQTVKKANPKMADDALMEKIYPNVTTSLVKADINTQLTNIIKAGLIGQGALNCIKTQATFFVNTTGYSCMSVKSPKP